MIENDDEKLVLGESVLREIFKEVPSAEMRPQQLKMMELIGKSLEGDIPALIQAGTGVGKSLGYLTPLIESGRKAIICTATKQLSEQIIFKDLPTASKAASVAVGKEVKYALLKGRSNYLCLKKYNELIQMDDNSSPVEGDSSASNSLEEILGAKQINETDISGTDDIKREYAAMYEWAEKTRTGDRTDAPDVSNKTWGGFSTDSDGCPGSACPFYKECFAEYAKHKAATSDIIVTNHSLVAHALNYGSEFVIGEREVLIVDEVHDFEKYITEAWGAEITAKALLDYVSLFSKNNSYEISSMLSLVTVNTENVQRLIEELGTFKETKKLDAKDDEIFCEAALKLLASLTEIRNRLDKLMAADDKTTDFAVNTGIPLHKRTTSLMERLAMVLDIANDDTVQWVEVRKTKAGKTINVIKAAPLDFSELLPEKILENELVFIGTSATIKSGNDFSSAVSNFGLEAITGEVIAEDVGTPFSYEKQGLLYIPNEKDIPAPAGAARVEHAEAVKNFCLDALEDLQGRTLILCTTQKSAEEIGQYLEDNLPKLNVLVQGDRQPKTLIEDFKEKAHTSVLVATMGMWHGLDIPGSDLSLVIIDKIPFAPIDDILTKAKMDRVSNRGGNSFSEVYLRDAVINLTQGVGRLIRRKDDRGMVAILDSRIEHKGYGRMIKASLPRLWFTNDKEVALSSLKRLSNEVRNADIHSEI